MKMEGILSDLQEALPSASPGKAKILLFLLIAFLVGIAFFVLVSHFIPPMEFQKYGYLGVFLANLLTSLSVIIPVHMFMPPGQALSVVVAASGSVVVVSVLASLASTLGELSAYYVGLGGKQWFHLDKYRQYRAAEKWMQRHAGFATWFFALVPLFFFDFVGIAAGAIRYPVRKFLLFTLLGRLPRAFAEIYLYTWIFAHIISYLPSWMSAPFS